MTVESTFEEPIHSTKGANALFGSVLVAQHCLDFIQGNGVRFRKCIGQVRPLGREDFWPEFLADPKVTQITAGL